MRLLIIGAGVLGSNLAHFIKKAIMLQFLQETKHMKT